MSDWVGFGWIAGEVSGPGFPSGFGKGARLRRRLHRLDSLVKRAGAEAARFLGVRPREIETVRARSRRKGRGAASAPLGIF